MHLSHVPAAHAPVIEIDPETTTLTWHHTDKHGQTAPDAHRVPWFASIGVLDYTRASTSPTGPQQPGHHEAAVAVPAYGDPLIVRAEEAAVFWRADNLLSSAPIQAGRVDFSAAAPVDCAAAPDRYLLIEHNLAQMAPVRTLDPPLHVLRVQASGRLSVARLVAGAEGAPVIGPVGHHYQPFVRAEELAAAAAGGLTGLAVLWESELRIGDTLGSWQVLAPPAALAALATAGFTVTGAPAGRPGLVSALATARQRWTTGWYAGTRLLALARYLPHRMNCWYDYDQPGLRRVAVATSDDPYDRGDLLGVHGPADVETTPPDQRVYVSMGWDGGGFAAPLRALPPRAARRPTRHRPDLVPGASRHPSSPARPRLPGRRASLRPGRSLTTVAAAGPPTPAAATVLQDRSALPYRHSAGVGEPAGQHTPACRVRLRQHPRTPLLGRRRGRSLGRPPVSTPRGRRVAAADPLTVVGSGAALGLIPGTPGRPQGTAVACQWNARSEAHRSVRSRNLAHPFGVIASDHAEATSQNP